MRKEVKKGDILKRPEYPGGQKALRDFIAREMRYPDSALQAGVEGTVHVRYAINHKGIVGEARVLRGLGYGCDEEALRLVGLLRFHVDKTRGVRVLYHKTIQIHFRLANAVPPPPQPVSEVHYHITPAKASPAAKAKDLPPSKPAIQITITFGE